MAPRRDSGLPAQSFGQLPSDAAPGEVVEALRRANLYLHILETIAIASNEATTVAEAFQPAVDVICEQIGWPVGHVYLRWPWLDMLEPTAIWHLDDPERYSAFRETTEATHLTAGVGLPGRVVEERIPVWLPDLAAVPKEPRGVLAMQAGIGAGFAFPVWVGDEIVAVFEFFTPTARRPDDELLYVVSQAGAQLGRVVERVRASDEQTVRTYQLEVANAELRQLDRLKAEFLAVVSHELRTPLSVVLGFATVLSTHWETMSDDSRREAVDDIYSQSRRLARGIEMALDIAQVDGGATAPMAERVEACDVVRRALDRVGPPDQLTVEVPAGLEVMVDRDLAAKALGELIDNACKYGEPPIQVVAREEVRHVAIDVLDRGEGVPPEFEPHLFERFAQASTGSTRTATGMGLGLGLARSLVRAQNGEASYRSRPDGGAVFTLTFPAARD